MLSWLVRQLNLKSLRRKAAVGGAGVRGEYLFFLSHTITLTLTLTGLMLSWLVRQPNLKSLRWKAAVGAFLARAGST